MSPTELDALRQTLQDLNFRLLELLNQRAAVVRTVQSVKAELGLPIFDPKREEEMLTALVAQNTGPFDDETIRQLFKTLFRASARLMEQEREHTLAVSRARRAEDLVLSLGNPPLRLGASPIVIAGPCAVESEEQIDTVARALAGHGVRLLRGGAFKPRTSPYAFQGLGAEGLRMLRDAARRHGLLCVSEVTDPRNVELVAAHVDLLQIGARNMMNYDLLREVGRARHPVVLKRAMAATLDELLWSAEYLMSEGNEQVVLCERGLRSFAPDTRFMLDISAVPLLRQRSYLPVLVDVSHAAGRRDILAPLARAALAAGAQGIMVEVHPQPKLARSDAEQQLDCDEFARFLSEIGWPW